MQLVYEYLAHRVSRGEYAASTVVNVRATLEQWCRHAGDVSGWTHDLVIGWVHDATLRANTRRMRRGRLRPFLAWLHRAKVLDDDLGADIPRVKAPPAQPRDLPDEAVRKLLAVCPDLRARLIVTLMVQCGLRCVDVSRVRIEDIDTRRHRLMVRAKGGGGDVTHTIPVPTEAWTLMMLHLSDEGRGTGPLIRNTRRLAPTPISAGRVSVLVRRWIAAAGLKEFPYDGTSAHALRHTCAQAMIDRGAQVRDVQYALGHRTAVTTETYLRREPSGLRDAMEGRRYLDAA